MKHLFEDIVMPAIKLLLGTIIWHFALFNLGRGSLLLITLGRYPRRGEAKLHENEISLVGILVLFMAWLSLVAYNHMVNSNV